RRAAEARAAAEREAAAKKAAAQDTPTSPAQVNPAKRKVDFDDVSITIQPFAPFAARPPENIRIRGDTICGYRIEERPARGNEPKWDAAYLQHEMGLERLRRLEGLLKKTDWLAAPHPKRPVLHPTKYSLTLKRAGQTRTVDIEGDLAEPYAALVSFFRD